MFNPIAWALRRPVTVLTLAFGLLLVGILAATRMRTDIFPNLNLPVIYVCQPYGGMDPSQMEGLLTNYYEYHFLYINGIHHVESRNVQGLALMKLFFHPGTDMAQAMAETMGYVTRSRAFMPPGTVSPFVTRFDAGSIPVGYLVLSSETRTINEIQDQALFKVRPMFSGLPGVSAPPPFGGTQRTIVVRLDPDRLRSYRMAPDEVIQALNTGNAISPSGTVRFGDSMPIVPVNALARDVEEFKQIPIRPGKLPTVHLGDVASVTDSADVPVGSAIIDGRKAVYLLVTKRADASTLDVIENVRNALPEMQAVLPPDIKVALEFDQSTTVTTAVQAVVTEAALGAGLVGLMVLLFLRDWRSMVIVIVNIPLALAGAVTLLWLSGQTFNLMTLGGLALAIGILVDESTVEVENIHTQMEHTPNVAVAVRRGNRETAVPRLLALLCMLAVFAPSFLMTGAVRSLFVPLSLAVGFAMVSSYLLSSTLVPVLSALLLKPHKAHAALADHSYSNSTARPVRRFARPVQAGIVFGYAVVCGLGIAWLAPSAGFEIFPKVDSGRFQVRVKAPAGTRYEKTERIVVDVLDAVKRIVGDDGVEVSVGYVGNIASSYPIQAIFQWTGGPEEAFLRVALDPQRARLSVDETKEKLREELHRIHPGVQFSLEPADIVSEVMSFGSPTPVDVVVSGSAYADVRKYATQLHDQLARLGNLRDLRYGQTLDYPALRVSIDRRLAGLAGLSAADVARSLVTATSSSRFILPSYWPDPKSGIGYQVQVEIPYASVVKAEDIENLPVNSGPGASPLVLRDVATVRQDTVPGEFDRYNMKRLISLTANVTSEDLATVAKELKAAIKAAGDPPAGVKVDVRGQLATLAEINSAGVSALIFTFVVILLMLTAYFQSPGLALVSLASVPAVGLGITLMLVLTGTTWNLQSYMGAIMALGVSVANVILLVSFAESERLAGAQAADAARLALQRRMRPILMTALAMIAGMLPMALGWSEGGRQQAPLGRAVIGGLLGSLVAVMVITPRAFALVRKNASRKNPSLDPTDPASPLYDPEADSPAKPMEVPLFRTVLTVSLPIVFGLGLPGSVSAQQATIPRVSVAEATPARIVHTVDQPGQVEPQAKAPLESRVAGWIKAVHVDIGDRVSAGQVLIEVAAPELEAAVAVSQSLVTQAKAETELAQAQFLETESSLTAQGSRLKAAEAELGGREAIVKQMKMERDRMRKLVENGAVTRVVLDEAEQRALSADADLLQSKALSAAAQADAETIRSQLVRRRAEIAVAEARAAVAAARLEEAKAQLDLARIKAPFDGFVTERHADPGKLVGETPSAKPLMIIEDVSVLTVSVGIPEAEAPLVSIGDEAVVFTGQDAAAPAFRGKVTRISRGYDPTTRTMRCEIDIPAEASALRSGQYVLVRIVGHDQAEAVTVPANAVFRIAGVPHVCVAAQGKATRRKVVPGVGDGTRLAISSGLNPGETVVVGPVAATLVDGTAIETIKPETPKP